MKNTIHGLTKRELERANNIHGDKFPSVEHAITVIREEVSEVKDEVKKMSKANKKFYKSYKKGILAEDEIKHLEIAALKCIEESIQVLAMIEKYKISKEGFKNA